MLGRETHFCPDRHWRREKVLLRRHQFGRLAIADDEEGVRSLAVVDEVADEQRVGVLGNNLAGHGVER
jgi:hypothetical protein